jgi:RNA-directed DNA polymerase
MNSQEAFRWWPTHGKTELLRCGHVTVRRYRYRGAQIPTPWAATG